VGFKIKHLENLLLLRNAIIISAFILGIVNQNVFGKSAEEENID